MFKTVIRQHCVVCNKIRAFQITQSAALLREAHCESCGISIRQHSIFLGLAHLEGIHEPFALRQLQQTLITKGRKIYNTVSSGNTHIHLKNIPGYVCSEYFSGVAPGSHHNGVLCQDLERLSFPDSSFDYVISEDVFEHIANWQTAAREVLRVLRPGGSHVFTLPVMAQHATIDRQKTCPKFPVYHGDSLTPGILVYTDFGNDLKELWTCLGYTEFLTVERLDLTTQYDLVETYIDNHEEWLRYENFRLKNDYLGYFCYNTGVHIATKKGTRMEFTSERMIPEHNKGTTVYLEHITRYHFASQIAQDKDVLDIACGSGYGSYELAKSGAKSVIGVDISAETVAYATGYYTHNNLQFKEGSATAIPLPDASVDIVVSFETIEHIDGGAQVQFMSEIKRVLRPDGVLIMSTPNVKVFPAGNEYHVKELTKEEYLSLLGVQFKNTKLYNQDSVEASFITDESQKASQVHLDITPNNCLYFVSVSSNIELPAMELRINASDKQFWKEYGNLHVRLAQQDIDYRYSKTVVNIIKIYKTRGAGYLAQGIWEYLRHGRKHLKAWLKNTAQD